MDIVAGASAKSIKDKVTENDDKLFFDGLTEKRKSTGKEIPQIL